MKLLLVISTLSMGVSFAETSMTLPASEVGVQCHSLSRPTPSEGSIVVKTNADSEFYQIKSKDACQAMKKLLKAADRNDEVIVDVEAISYLGKALGLEINGQYISAQD